VRERTASGSVCAARMKRRCVDGWQWCFTCKYATLFFVYSYWNSLFTKTNNYSSMFLLKYLSFILYYVYYILFYKFLSYYFVFLLYKFCTTFLYFRLCYRFCIRFLYYICSISFGTTFPYYILFYKFLYTFITIFLKKLLIKLLATETLNMPVTPDENLTVEVCSFLIYIKILLRVVLSSRLHIRSQHIYIYLQQM